MRKIPILLLLAFFLQSCGGGGSSNSAATAGADTAGADTVGTDEMNLIGEANCPALVGPGGAGAIAGLYDVSLDSEFGQDIFYIQIDANGSITSYDYQQDEVDSGDNCYIIETGVSILTSRGNNVYENTYYDDIEFNCNVFTQELTVTRSNATLTVSSVDRFDEDDDGDTTDSIVETYPVLTGISAASFNNCQ